jgi:hypothetical protein
MANDPKITQDNKLCNYINNSLYSMIKHVVSKQTLVIPFCGYIPIKKQKYDFLEHAFRKNESRKQIIKTNKNEWVSKPGK